MAGAVSSPGSPGVPGSSAAAGFRATAAAATGLGPGSLAWNLRGRRVRIAGRAATISAPLRCRPGFGRSPAGPPRRVVAAARIVRMPASSESDPLDLAVDPAEAGEPIDLSEASILLVDDNVQNLELIQAYLEALPCALHVAHDGVEAMEQVARHHPDLVLLDVMMPRMSGFEVCRRIKTNPQTRQILVIMVTALNEVADYERAVESGTDDFLSKPVNKLELLTRIRSLLRVALLRRKLDRLVGRRDGESG